jgi:hypothetical protein
MVRPAIATLVLALALPTHSSGVVPQENAAAALKVLEKTKSTRATYSVFFWNRVDPGNRPAFEEWSAEFHMGALHRVETPRDRLIADCSKLTGVAISLQTGETIEGPAVARAGCGINTNKPMISAELRGAVKTEFGSTERVRVTDAEHVREYDVSEDGILLQSTYREGSANGRLSIAGFAVGLERRVSSPDMFSRASLSPSFVPAKYMLPPPGRSKD